MTPKPGQFGSALGSGIAVAVEVGTRYIKERLKNA
jgi:hypothetical protein